MNEAVGKTITLKHTFKAPREKVWEMWTDPQHFSQWWSPDYFTIPVCELDVRPGGKMKVHMQGPDKTIYPSVGEFTVVQKPAKLQFRMMPLNDAGQVMFEILQTAEFSDEDETSTLQFTSEVVSVTPEAAPYLAGMEEGLNQCLGKLAKLLG